MKTLRCITFASLALGTALLTGCVTPLSHAKKSSTPPPPGVDATPLKATPVAEPVPVHPGPAPSSEPPVAEAPPAPVEEAPKPVVRHHRPKPNPATPADGASTDSKTADAPAATTTAKADTPAAEGDSPIGQLTAGDSPDAGAEKKQAADLIAANDRRLRSIRHALSTDEQHTVAQVRKFQQQARQALAGGDMHAAQTLATKAKLLLDELHK